MHEYRAGQFLLVTATVPVSGHYLDIGPHTPSLALGLVLRPTAIAGLLPRTPPGRWSRAETGPPAIATGTAGAELLDAAARLLRLLDHPADDPVLAPLIEREILWRLLSGSCGAALRQIGVGESGAHINRAIQWLRDNDAEPMRVARLAGLSGMSPSAFHRHFRAITAMSPLQYQKRLRLQEARSLLAAHPGDVAGIGHLVGYDSPSQCHREYRRLFGCPPGAGRRPAADRVRSRARTPA